MQTGVTGRFRTGIVGLVEDEVPAVVQEVGQGLGLAPEDGGVEAGPAGPVQRPHVCPVEEEELQHLEAAQDRRDVQRGLLVGVGVVDDDPVRQRRRRLLQEGPHARGVAARHRGLEGRLSKGRVGVVLRAPGQADAHHL